MGVGKSCIIKRFCESKFYDRFKPTIGIDYGTKGFLHGKTNKQSIKVDFWDMSGHEEFEEVRAAFYKNTQICLLVFDCSDKESFANLDKWIKEATKYQMPSSADVYLLCNKVDSRYRVISADQAKEWIANKKSYNIKYVETSAKSGQGVQDLFASIFCVE